MISCVRSVPHPEAVAELVQEVYALPVRGCTLIRSLVNDVYEVVTAERRYVCKVYAAGDHSWSTAEVIWEQELAAYLSGRGVPVPPVVPLASGELVGELSAPEGRRPYVLSGYVEGEKPTVAVDDQLYRAFGRLIARFHQIGDGFSSSRPRRPLDARMTLWEPLESVLPVLADRPDDARLLRDIAEDAVRHLPADLDWGVRHGDVTLDNLRLTADGLVLYDFDCAALGWRVADLTGVAATEHWPAFRDGYREIRPLPDSELAALPWLSLVERIANLFFHLVRRPRWQGIESRGDGEVDRELGALRHEWRRIGCAVPQDRVGDYRPDRLAG
jgi:Ser/Thr protein kinase RdoA (MazF antagonist)